MHAQQEILEVLKASAEPMQWAALKRSCGIGPTFDAALARLVDKGLVEKDTRGRYRLTGGLIAPDELVSDP